MVKVAGDSLVFGGRVEWWGQQGKTKNNEQKVSAVESCTLEC